MPASLSGSSLVSTNEDTLHWAWLVVPTQLGQPPWVGTVSTDVNAREETASSVQ